MKKTTINTILIAIITIMSVSVCFLIFCIATRPRYVIVSEPEKATIVESASLSENVQARNADNAPDSDTVSAADSSTAVMHGKTSTRVNIRDSASENARVLDTVEEGTTFDIIEILDNGWTKILYQDTEAYISSSFVIVLND